MISILVNDGERGGDAHRWGQLHHISCRILISFFFFLQSPSESEGESSARDGKITQLLLGDSWRAVR